MKTLHFTLKKKWFDMIASGEKKEEYREVKPYWVKRFKVHQEHDTGYVEFMYDFDRVEFRHGYSKNAPKMSFALEDIDIKKGRPEWGAEPGKKYFVIKLGERV